jgi:cytochrome c
MNLQPRLIALTAALATAPLLALSFDAAAVDASAASALARQNNCTKCHAPDKKKDGPSWKEIATKYKGKADAEATFVKHVTSGEKSKFPDGHEEEHPIIKTKDQDAIKNLAAWILSTE